MLSAVSPRFPLRRLCRCWERVVVLVLLWCVMGDTHRPPSSTHKSGVWLPVPLTVVPIGVQVGGTAENTLSRWLLHSLHTSPVVRTAWTGTGFNSSSHTDVMYRYDVKVATVAEEVHAAVSARLRWWARKGGVDGSGRDVWCIEAFHVEDLLSQLAATLRPHIGAVPHSPFLFVLHPNVTDAIGGHVSANKLVYGYRGGLCPLDLRAAGHDATVLEEVDFLVALDSRAARKFAANAEFEDGQDGGEGDTQQHNGGDGGADAGGRGPRPATNYEDDDDAAGALQSNVTTVQEVDVTAVSREWAATILGEDLYQWDSFAQLSVPELALTLLRNADARRSRTVLEQLRVAVTSDPATADNPHPELLEGSDTGDFVRSGLTSVISDAVVGAGRVAWLDVGAAYLDWAPPVGGGDGGGAQRRVSIVDVAEARGPTITTNTHLAVGERVGSAVSSFLHQIVTPPWADVGAIQPASGATTPQPAARITYTIFLVDVHSTSGARETARMPAAGSRSAKHVQHTTYNPLGGDGLNVDMLKRELVRAALPGQDVSVTVHLLGIDDDPAVAMAYAMGLRHSQVMRVPPSSGLPVFEEQPFLDSAVVADLLSSSAGLSSLKRQAGALSTLNVPIFLFSVDAHPPVLVDKRFQAAASHGVVVATQSSQLAWPASATTVNGAEYVRNLRNPSTPILLAALQLTGGVVPSHVAARGEDWRWVAGAAVTTTLGAAAGAVSGFMTDSMRRAAVATVLLNVTAALHDSEAATHRSSSGGGGGGGGRRTTTTQSPAREYAVAVADVSIKRDEVVDLLRVGDLHAAFGVLPDLARATDVMLNRSAVLTAAQSDAACAPRGVSTFTRVWLGAGSLLALVVAIVSVRSIIIGWLDGSGRFGGGPPKLHIN